MTNPIFEDDLLIKLNGDLFKEKETERRRRLLAAKAVK